MAAKCRHAQAIAAILLATLALCCCQTLGQQEATTISSSPTTSTSTTAAAAAAATSPNTITSSQTTGKPPLQDQTTTTSAAATTTTSSRLAKVINYNNNIVCKSKSRSLKVGESFNDECLATCTCHKDGEIRCKPVTCPLDPAPGEPCLDFVDPDGCCPPIVCQKQPPVAPIVGTTASSSPSTSSSSMPTSQTAPITTTTGTSSTSAASSTSSSATSAAPTTTTTTTTAAAATTSAQVVGARSCTLMGKTIQHNETLPEEIMPLNNERLCICNDAKIVCQPYCPPAGEVPPDDLGCQQDQAVKVNEDGCIKWSCPNYMDYVLADFSVSAANATQAEVNFELPPFAIGRRGRAQLNYTGLPLRYDAITFLRESATPPPQVQWQVKSNIKTADGVFSNRKVRYYLNDLRPEHRYWFKLVVYFTDPEPPFDEPLESELVSMNMPALPVDYSTTLMPPRPPPTTMQQQPSTTSVITSAPMASSTTAATTTTSTSTTTPTTTTTTTNPTTTSTTTTTTTTTAASSPPTTTTTPTTTTRPPTTTTTTTMAPPPTRVLQVSTLRPLTSLSARTTTTTVAPSSSNVPPTVVVSPATSSRSSTTVASTTRATVPTSTSAATSTSTSTTTTTTELPNTRSQSSTSVPFVESELSSSKPSIQEIDSKPAGGCECRQAIESNRLPQDEGSTYFLPSTIQKRIEEPLQRYTLHLLVAFAVMSVLFVIVSFLYLRKSTHVIAPITSKSAYEDPSFTKLVGYYANQPHILLVDETGQNYNNDVILAKQKNLEVDKSSPFHNNTTNSNNNGSNGHHNAGFQHHHHHHHPQLQHNGKEHRLI